MKKKLNKVHCIEIATGEKTLCYWTDKQCELADYLARISVFCLIEPLGYFYRFEDLNKALPKVMENPYWRELSPPSLRGRKSMNTTSFRFINAIFCFLAGVWAISFHETPLIIAGVFNLIVAGMLLMTVIIDLVSN